MSNSTENVLKAEKRRKLQCLMDANINPFPYSFDKDISVSEIIKQFSDIENGAQLKEKSFKMAGRLMAKRIMGKAAFLNIQDQSGTIQIYVKKSDLDEIGEKSFDLIDIGDFVGIKGFVFKTKKGELSLLAEEFQILCKTLEPLPEKFHGISDPEIKYRYRHLDLIMDKNSRDVFAKRSLIIKEIRNFLNNRGFMEVEVPTLQPIYGGAAATPFSTHHKTLDMKLFMKISPELYLKRLIVGGFEKVYDLGKNFRNEGVDRTHNPEFTMLEWYEAYTDYNYQMTQFEDLVTHLAKKIKGSTKFSYQGKDIDFTTPWKRLSVYQGIREFAKVDPEKISDADLIKELQKYEKDIETKLSRGALLMKLFEHTAEEHIWNPTFIIDHPKEISPLTKVHRNDNNLVERFEPFAAGMELGNAYSELNNPVEQRERFKAQEALRVIDNEAQPMDENFLHAIEVGMPPTGGVGLGVDRVVMLLTDQSTIRDIILFPAMKHKQ